MRCENEGVVISQQMAAHHRQTFHMTHAQDKVKHINHTHITCYQGPAARHSRQSHIGNSVRVRMCVLQVVLVT